MSEFGKSGAKVLWDALGQHVCEVGHPFRVARADLLVAEVRTVVAGRSLQRSGQAFVDVEFAKDVAEHRGRRSAREGEQRRRDVAAISRSGAQGGREAQVCGPEVVSPLGHAVGLVHDDRADEPVAGRLGEVSAKAPILEPLWGRKDEQRLAPRHRAQHPVALSGSLHAGGMHGANAVDAIALEALRLVVD